MLVNSTVKLQFIMCFGGLALDLQMRCTQDWVRSPMVHRIWHKMVGVRVLLHESLTKSGHQLNDIWQLCFRFSQGRCSWQHPLTGFRAAGHSVHRVHIRCVVICLQANEALNQFRSIDRHNRKQYFYLNLLVQDRSESLWLLFLCLCKTAVSHCNCFLLFS